ncbi:MAG: hypothetical protein ACI87W_003322 [Halieaceae bacterium]|jgi:hypothetical protein
MLVGQDLFVLFFDPPPALEELLVDKDCPRTGPAVLLFADSINLDEWAAEPREPQKSLWTEVAIGYSCDFDGAPATAFHYPWLKLSRAYGDPLIPLAKVEMSRFHSACPDYDAPMEGRRCEATASTLTGDLIANLEIRLQQPASETIPAGLMRWVNRISYPDVTHPGESMQLGMSLVWAEELELSELWTGEATANFGIGMGWTGTANGHGWKFGAKYRLTTADSNAV